MTIEEAIQNRERCLAYLERDPAAADPDSVEAVRMSIAALRARQTPAKLDRSRWEGCGLCKKASRISGSAFIHYGHEEVSYDGLTFSYMKYCPRCGRPLTEEVCAEPERRIGGNDGTTDILE